MKKLSLSLLIGVVIASAACSPTNSQVARITSLPPDQSTPTPVLDVPDVDALTDESQALPATATPPTLTGFEALAVYGLQTQAAMGDLPTPTPWNRNLQPGEARSIAMATDIAYRPTLENSLTFTDNPVALTFDEFYDGFNMRTGLILSDKLRSLDGQRVVMEGYMAPPLKPELDFFVLTRIRLAFCPFCTTAADWPDDIAVVYLTEATVGATLNPVRVTGQIEVGMVVDQETGMVSLVRLYVDNLEILS